jgi:hypothetical protein
MSLSFRSFDTSVVRATAAVSITTGRELDRCRIICRIPDTVKRRFSASHVYSHVGITLALSPGNVAPDGISV